jgi:SAM-dependent methyltransferase
MDTDSAWLGTMPEVYDRDLGPVLFEPFATEVARRVAEMSPRTILEVAAGTGLLTAAVTRALPNADMDATDLNPAMVGYAAARVPAARWQSADASDLPFPADSFDVVVCQFGVMFFPDKRAAFSEMNRVLRPGGRLLFATWDLVETSPMTAALVQGLAAVLPERTPSFVVRIPHGYADVKRIRADVQAGGFEEVTIDRVVLRGRGPSAASLAEGFALGSPLRFALQERGALDDLAQRLAQEMTARLGNGPIEGDLAAFVVAARSPDGTAGASR